MFFGEPLQGPFQLVAVGVYYVEVFLRFVLVVPHVAVKELFEALGGFRWRGNAVEVTGQWAAVSVAVLFVVWVHC